MLAYRLLSQIVRIYELDFERSSFRVSTELSIVALRSDVTSFALSLGKNCILPNEPNFTGAGRVTINGIDTAYSRNKLNMFLSEEQPERSLLALKKAFIDARKSRPGDLVVEIPKECLGLVPNQKVMQLNIDLIVSNPKEGIIFCFDGSSPDKEGNSFQGAHVYTYRSNPVSSTKEWLPCADHPAQLCVWRFEVTVPKEIQAICCGDLVDTFTEESGIKTFHYQLLVPTAAGNIGFVIGDLQMHVQPEMPEIISFTLPPLMPLLRHTMSSLNRIFVFFEELLSCRFPYGTYWQVFVDQTPDDMTTFAGLSIFSFKVLYHKKILDLVQQSRQTLAKAVAQQFFGCFINPLDFSEYWLTKALASYITGIFVERIFGICESLYQLQRVLRDACEYETRFGRITLKAREGRNDGSNFYFDHTSPDTCSPLYLDALAKKGHFVLRMLERRLPKEQFIKVLQRVLSIGMQHSQNMERPIEWAQLLICTKTFMRTVTDVTGQEFPTFVEQWIETGGHVQFQVSHTFNRKRNMIELELRQATPLPVGCQNYTGPLTVMVQELDGHFVHSVQVDAAISKHDIQCHSKVRKLKRKRIVLGTGEEMDMELAQMDAESPVLWIRIDPELLLYRQMAISQPFYQWEFMLLHERDVLAQQLAVEMLYNYPRHQTRAVLEETVRNEKFFYRIRKDAAYCLVHIYNSLPDSQLGESPPLIDYFRQQFCAKTCPQIPQPNNYVATASNLQNYFLLQTLPSAIGSIRGQGGKQCPDYVVEFLLELLRLNDNSTNRYSDDYYRGALLHALGKTLVIADRPAQSPEELSPQVKEVLTEATHALNMDTMKPSFGRVISTHCMHVLYELQRCQHIPLDTEVFWKFGQSQHVFPTVCLIFMSIASCQLRYAALACIVAMVRRSRLQIFVRTIQRLVEVVVSDPDPYIRYALAQRLCAYPPFEAADNPAIYPLNTRRLAQFLWMIISSTGTETRTRVHLTDLYFILYGTGTPSNFSSY